MILKLKNINFTAIKVLFIKDVDVDNVLVPNKVSSGEKNYKYFIGYLHEDYKIKSFYIMLPKTSAYLESMMVTLNRCIFWLKMMPYWRNIIVFRIKSALILIFWFDNELVYYKNVLKTKIKSYEGETTDFYGKEIPKTGSNHTCLAVITIDAALEKDENYYSQVFLKECKYTEEEKSD